MLQIREEKEHWLVADERIHMFFLDPRWASNPYSFVLLQCTLMSAQVEELQ
jgi:hypothetical protein